MLCQSGSHVSTAACSRVQHACCLVRRLASPFLSTSLPEHAVPRCAARPLAGEKINLPSLPIPAVITKLLTPRGAASVQGTPRTAQGPLTARTPRTARGPPTTRTLLRSQLASPRGPHSDQAVLSADSDSTAGDAGAPAGEGAAAAAALAPRASAAAGAAALEPDFVAGAGPGRPSQVQSTRNSLARNSLGARASYTRISQAHRESWIAYYHGDQPRPPTWRTKLQKAVQRVVQHPGALLLAPWGPRCVAGGVACV